MGSTNYTNTFIQVADDCPVASAEQPPITGKALTVAALQYALLTEHPYEFTSDDVLFEVHATRHGIPEADRAAAREAFFATSQACLRSSPLAKRYGWGIHHSSENKIALIPLGTDDYAKLAAKPEVSQTTALRSKRA